MSTTGTALPVRRRLEMPFALLCGMALSAFFAGVGALAYTAIVIGSLFTERFTFNDHPVSRGEFFRQTLPFLLAYAIILGAFGVISFALWKERLWAREAIMVFWGLTAATQLVVISVTPEKVSGGTIVATLLWVAGCWGLAAWYLYGKGNVCAYYLALARQAVPGEPPAS
jgi:hypothetical protein